MMTNYQKILEMLIKYGTPEIEAEVVDLVRNCIFRYSDIDKIELDDDTIYRSPLKNVIEKMEEVAPNLSKEEKEEMLKLLKENNKIFSYLRSAEDIRRLQENEERAKTVLY